VQNYPDNLIGLEVSHVWRGHGSAIFIEFGNLIKRTRRGGSPANPIGEFTLMIEWSWRIEKSRSICVGSFSSDRKWDSVFKKLLAAKVTGVEFFGFIPEIVITLSNGYRVLSFMTEKGQPSWAVLSQNPKLGSLCVKRGKLCIEHKNS
jgi:hypothetical protein